MVCTGFRPLGIVLTSMILVLFPFIANAKLRGIGVADILMQWIPSLAFSIKASRCATPNRCSSSVIKSARSLYSTFSDSTELVPIMIFTEPSLIRAIVFFLSVAFCPSTKSSTSIPTGVRSFLKSS